MDQKWTVTVWGVRGSLPVASADFLEFGGNTSCISINCGDELVVLDAGTGIAGLGSLLARQAGLKKLHLLISHLHLDHILGIMGFQTLYDPEAEIHLYGESRGGRNILDWLGQILTPPYWPVGPEDFQAKIVVHEVGPGQHIPLTEALYVDTLRGDHPNQSLIYRIAGGGKRVVYALDCEMGEGMEARLAEFAQGCDLLIWDANFIPAELRSGWGHSTWEQGVALRRRAGAKTVLMTHFSHWYEDAVLQWQERLALAADGAVRFARERMELEL